MKILLNILCFSLFLGIVNAQLVTIPDVNFRNYLINHPGIDVNDDDLITEDEARNFNDSIIVNAMFIGSLSGIEYFNNITYLDCRNNSTMSGIDLRNNKKLKYIDVSGCNYIPFLNIMYNNDLKILRANAMYSLSCLDLSTVTNLEQLSMTSWLASNRKLNIANGNNSAITSLNFTGTGAITVQSSNTTLPIWTSLPALSTNSTDAFPFTTTLDLTAFGSCTGSAAFSLDTTGMLASSVYHMDFGDGNYKTNLQLIYLHDYDIGGLYYSTFESRSCFQRTIDTSIVTIGTPIAGRISYSGGEVTNGRVALYRLVGPLQVLDSIHIRPILAGGNYLFPYVSEGNYIVKVFPNRSMYPSVIPTLYGDVWQWTKADTIHHTCSSLDINIDVDMVEYLSGSGANTLSGFITEGVGFGRAIGDPIRTGDVKLGIQGTGLLREATITDSINGYFEFTNVPNGNYFVYVDIPGLYCDTTDTYVYRFTLSGSENYYHLNYVADSVEVKKISSIGIEDENGVNFSTSLFPNPVKDLTTLNIELSADKEGYFTIVDQLGKLVYQSSSKNWYGGGNLESIDVKGWSKGIYYLNVFIGDSKKVLKLLKQ